MAHYFNQVFLLIAQVFLLVAPLLHSMDRPLTINSPDVQYILFKLDGYSSVTDILLKKSDALRQFSMIKNTLEIAPPQLEICGTNKEGPEWVIPFSISTEVQQEFGIEPRHVRQLCSLATKNFGYNFVHNATDLKPVIHLMNYYGAVIKEDENNQEMADPVLQEKMYTLADKCGLVSHLYNNMYSRSNTLWHNVQCASATLKQHRVISRGQPEEVRESEENELKAKLNGALAIWRAQDPDKIMFDMLVAHQKTFADFPTDCAKRRKKARRYTESDWHKVKETISSIHTLSIDNIDLLESGHQSCIYVNEFGIEKIHLPLIEALRVTRSDIYSGYNSKLRVLEPVDMQAMQSDVSYSFSGSSIETIPVAEIPKGTALKIDLTDNPLNEQTLNEIHKHSHSVRPYGNNKNECLMHERYWWLKLMKEPAVCIGTTALIAGGLFCIAIKLFEAETKRVDAFIDKTLVPTLTPTTAPVYRWMWDNKHMYALGLNRNDFGINEASLDRVFSSMPLSGNMPSNIDTAVQSSCFSVLKAVADYYSRRGSISYICVCSSVLVTVVGSLISAMSCMQFYSNIKRYIKNEKIYGVPCSKISYTDKSKKIENQASA